MHPVMKTAQSAVVIGGVLTVASWARAERNDILVALTPGDPVTVTINGVSGVETTRDGSVSLQTDRPFCVGEPASPCSYTVNVIKLRLDGFQVDTNQGTYSFSDAYALIRGPLTSERPTFVKRRGSWH